MLNFLSFDGTFIQLQKFFYIVFYNILKKYNLIVY